MRFRMLNLLLTPLKTSLGLNSLFPCREQTATDNNMTTPPNRSSRVTFNLHYPPPDEESLPDYSHISSVPTSTSTRPASEWH